MNVLSDLDKKIINDTVNSIKEKGIKNESLFIHLDNNAIRERRWGLYFWGEDENIGGSVDVNFNFLKKESKLFNICVKNIFDYSDIIIKIIIYCLENDEKV